MDDGSINKEMVDNTYCYNETTEGKFWMETYSVKTYANSVCVWCEWQSLKEQDVKFHLKQVKECKDANLKWTHTFSIMKPNSSQAAHQVKKCAWEVKYLFHEDVTFVHSISDFVYT